MFMSSRGPSTSAWWSRVPTRPPRPRVVLPKQVAEQGRGRLELAFVWSVTLRFPFRPHTHLQHRTFEHSPAA